jgi:hypothetical protein
MDVFGDVPENLNAEDAFSSLSEVAALSIGLIKGGKDEH